MKDVPVGKIEQHEDAVYHGITQSDQGVKAAPLQGIDQILHEKVKRSWKAAPVKRKGKQASPLPFLLGRPLPLKAWRPMNHNKSLSVSGFVQCPL
jgi:hypothetical protein